MYSEDSSVIGGDRVENAEDIEQMMRASLRRREEEFYGDERPKENKKFVNIEDGVQDEATEDSSNKN